MKVAEVVFFVRDPAAAAAWYRSCTGASDSGPYRARWGDVELTFHRADAKNAAGTGGQVAYFSVGSFAAMRQRLETAGANLYRGPRERSDGKIMAQFRDPFGNLLGVVGR